MSRRTDYACELSCDKDTHYNCCQKVVISFCDVCNIDKKTAYNIGNHFGGGMKVGATCGALSGALIVLGNLDVSNNDVKQYIEKFEDIHGDINCKQLLLKVDENLSREKLCSGLVKYCIEQIEELANIKE